MAFSFFPFIALMFEKKNNIMDIFKSDILKKELKELIKIILLNLNNCGNCGIFCCKHCSKFSVYCNLCKKAWCRYRQAFEQSKETLLNGGDEICKNYVANFIVDYFGMSETTAEFFNLKISDTVREKDNFIVLHRSKTGLKDYNVAKNKDKTEYWVKERKHCFFR